MQLFPHTMQPVVYIVLALQIEHSLASPSVFMFLTILNVNGGLKKSYSSFVCVGILFHLLRPKLLLPAALLIPLCAGCLIPLFCLESTTAV
jgi:hypothetical protein